MLLRQYDMAADKGIRFKDTSLEQFPFAVRRYLTDEMRFANPEMSTWIEQTTMQMAMELRDHIWAEVLQDETVTLDNTVSYPASWWDHFKKEKFPKWLLERFPAKMVTERKTKSHNFRTIALFPDFKYEVPDRVGRTVLRTMIQ